MIAWLMTVAVALFVGRIVWAEVRCGRRNHAFLSKIDQDIEALRSQVIVTYKSRHGADPIQTDKT